MTIITPLIKRAESKTDAIKTVESETQLCDNLPPDHPDNVDLPEQPLSESLFVDEIIICFVPDESVVLIKCKEAR